MPATTRALADVLVDRLRVPDGRVELEVKDGVVKFVWRHERIPARALDAFDGEPGQIVELLMERVASYRS